MIKNSFLFLLLASLFSCTKEVKIDIPGYKAELVVDGNIETGQHPIVLLSQAGNVYAESYIESYVYSFVTTADVKVVVENDTFILSPILLTDLPESTQKKFAEMLKADWPDILQLPIQIYTNNDLIGEAGKAYKLIINYKDKSYEGITTLAIPVHLQSVFWKIEPETVEYGFSHAILADPPNVFNAYKWEVKRINIQPDGTPRDYTFRKVAGAHFRDRYFDGMTIEVTRSNPLKRKDSTHLEIYKHYYRLGDSVVIKFSSIDKNTYEFFRAKSAQLENAGNPFSTPINLPTNMSNGALGIWAGYSTTFDTLWCVE